MRRMTVRNFQANVFGLVILACIAVSVFAGVHICRTGLFGTGLFGVIQSTCIGLCVANVLMRGILDSTWVRQVGTRNVPDCLGTEAFRQLAAAMGQLGFDMTEAGGGMPCFSMMRGDGLQLVVSQVDSPYCPEDVSEPACLAAWAMADDPNDIRQVAGGIHLPEGSLQVAEWISRTPADMAAASEPLGD